MDKRKLKRSRKFSEHIRRKVVKEFRSGTYTVQELSDLYHCSTTTIYRWIYRYSPADQPKLHVVEMAGSSDQKLKELQQQITDLQAALGRKQMQVDFYEKMMDLAKEEYDLDLKKNSSTPVSHGSVKTDKP